MLIGNVGKEPDVRYYDADQCVAKVTLATTERGYVLKTEQRFQTVPTGIVWFSTGSWPRSWSNMFIRVTNSMSRGVCGITLTMTSRGAVIMSRRFRWKIWSSLHPNPNQRQKSPKQQNRQVLSKKLTKNFLSNN